MIVGILIVCVIIAMSAIIYRIWSKDTVDYRLLFNLPKVKEKEKEKENEEIKDLKIKKSLARRDSRQEEERKELEEYNEYEEN